MLNKLVTLLGVLQSPPIKNQTDGENVLNRGKSIPAALDDARRLLERRALR